MKIATVRSRCECQSTLGALLDERKCVVKGWARERDSDVDVMAPAHSIGRDKDVFQVGWFCPFCIRNTLRSFEMSGLSYRNAASSSAAGSGEAPSLRQAQSAPRTP